MAGPGAPVHGWIGLDSGLGVVRRSASGSGVSREEARRAGGGKALVSQGAIAYSDYVADQVDDTIATTRAFTNAVRAGNLRAARAAYAPSREAGSASSRSPA